MISQLVSFLDLRSATLTETAPAALVWVAALRCRNVGSDEGDVVSDCAHFLLKYGYGAVHQRQSIELSP